MTAFLSFLRGGCPSFPWFRAFALILGLTAIVTLGQLPLLDEDEGEYSEVAAEMASSGQYFVPTLNQTPFFEKPILLFWVQQPLVQWWGASEWAFRVPSLIASFLLLYLMYQFMVRSRGEEEAILGVSSFGLSLGVMIAARAATMDMLVLLFLTLTLFAYGDYVSSGSRSSLRKSYVYAALGFLTKGPMAIVIPALVALVLGVTTPSTRARVFRSLDGLGLLFFCGIALPWFIWYGIHTDGAFTDYFFFRENLGRLHGSLQGHSGSIFYYFIVLPLITLPFPVLVWGSYRTARLEMDRPETRYLAIWFVVVFVLFSLAGTKLPHYLLYGLPPLFMLGVGSFLKAGKRFPYFLMPGIVLPLVGLILPVLVKHLSTSINNAYLAEMFWEGMGHFDQAYVVKAFIWCLLTVVLMGYGFIAETQKQRMLLTVSMGLTTAFGVSLILLPAVTSLQQDPVREAALLARSFSGPVVSDNRMPSFSVYLGRPTEVRAPRAGDIAFGRLDHPDRLGTRFETLYAKQGVRLVRVIAP